MSEGNTITLYPYTESSLSRRIKEKQRREMMAMDKQDEEEKLVIAKSDLARLLSLLPPPSTSEPVTQVSTAAAPSTSSTPFNKLPPRFQLRRARKVFQDYNVHGTSKVESTCLLPMLKELMGEDVMLKVGGGIRWWVMGVSSGDVTGFLDGSDGFSDGTFGEDEFSRVAAAVSEAWTREERKEGSGEKIKVVVRNEGRGRRGRRGRRKRVEEWEEEDDGSDFESDYGHDDDEKEVEKFVRDQHDIANKDVEEYVDEEVRIMEESPMHRLVKEDKAAKERTEREAQEFEERCTTRGELEIRKKKADAWTVGVDAKEEVENVEDFIDKVINEDVPTTKPPLPKAPPAPRGMSALDDVKIKTLRIMLEAADASGTYNGALSGVVNARIFERSVANTLGFKVDCEGLLGKGGVCYRVFLRDPEAWGWQRKEVKGRKVQTEGDIEGGLLRRVRQKIVKTAEGWDKGGYGLGLMDCRRQFEALDKTGRGIESRMFLRCLKRVGISLSKKGEKRLLRELEGVDGYNNGLVRWETFFDFVTDKEEEDKELGRKCVSAVVGAMERSGCNVNALRGAMEAYDEVGRGELVKHDFIAAMQQCGVGRELSKGVVEGIGRRWVGTKGVAYSNLLEEVAEEVEKREKIKRRKDVLKRMEEGKGVVGVMREWEEDAENKIVGGQFDIFVPEREKRKPYVTTRGKAASGRFGKDKTRKEAWRGNRGFAPSKLPNKSTTERFLPKYLRGVESKIKEDIKTRKARGRKLEAAKLEIAKQVVAERRLKKYEIDGVIVTGETKETLAREIAGIYEGVVDSIVVEDKVEKEYWDEPDSEDSDEEEVDVDGFIVKQKEYTTIDKGGWVGDFDMTDMKKKKVKDKEVMGGKDEEIITAKASEGED